MKLTRLRPAAILIAAAVALVAAPAAHGIDLTDLGSPVNIKTYTSLNQIPQGGMAHVAVELKMNSPWHVNAHEVKDEFAVPTEVQFEAPEGVNITQVVYPDGHEMKLDFSDTPMMLYSGTVYVGAVVEVAKDVPVGDNTIKAVVTYQACDNEKCLLPQTETAFVPIKISSPIESVDLVNGEIFEKIEFDAVKDAALAPTSFGNKMASHGLFAMFALVFLGGLALNLTPCVFPIIPITVSYFGNQAGGRMSKTVMLAVFYLLGMATMYSALGLVAALTGSLFGSALQNPIVLVFIALVMVGLSLSMFGLYEIRIPMRLAGVAGTAKTGMAGSFLMGLTVGIVAAPCIGPFVLGLLTFVGEMGRPVMGFLLFFTLAVGLGLPYVFLAIASGSMSRLPKSGEWMEWVRRLFGMVLIAMAVYFLRPMLGDPLFFAAMGGVLIVGGIIMGYVLKASSKILFISALRRFVGVAAPLYGIYLILAPGHIIARGHADGIPWQPYDVSVLESAVKDGRPVVIDFSADWCLPCRELEHKTFNQPEVIEAAKDVVPLRADLTRSASDEVLRLREQYQIRGVPTVVFIDASGKERPELRAVQFINKDEFLKRLSDLRG